MESITKYFVVDAKKRFLTFEGDNKLSITEVTGFPVYYKTEEMANGMLRALSSNMVREKMILDKNVLFPLQVIRVRVSYEEVK